MKKYVSKFVVWMLATLVVSLFMPEFTFDGKEVHNNGVLLSMANSNATSSPSASPTGSPDQNQQSSSSSNTTPKIKPDNDNKLTEKQYSADNVIDKNNMESSKSIDSGKITLNIETSGKTVINENTINILKNLASPDSDKKITGNNQNTIHADNLKLVFDAEYYAIRYPDVAEMYGDDAELLFNHFLEFGIWEGRAGSDSFDVGFYIMANPDLWDIFGDDIAAYVLHYLTHGLDEGRLTGLEINGITKKNEKEEFKIIIFDIKNINTWGLGLKISGTASGAEIIEKEKKHSSSFENNVKILSIDHNGSFGHDVRVCVNIDLEGKDLTKLKFYWFDEKNNKYNEIKNPNYKIDENGFLHFSTQHGGDIIITDGILKQINENQQINENLQQPIENLQFDNDLQHEDENE